MKYIVAWEIDIDADSARDAALQARAFQLDPNTTAVVFSVTDVFGNCTHVDLLENEQPDPNP